MAQSVNQKEAPGTNAEKRAPEGQPAVSMEKKAAKSKPKKKKGGLIGLVFLIILTIIATAFLYFSIQFNWGGVRDKLIETVNSLDPEYVIYTEKIEDLNKREQQILLLEKKLEAEELKLSQKKTDLDKQEANIKEQEIVRLPIYRRILNDEDLQDMKSLSKIYAQMAPGTAAGILTTLYDIDDRAAIIYFMSEASAAAIMQEMEVRDAAEITDALLRN